MKKFLAFALVVSLIACMFVGCAKTDSSTEPKVPDTTSQDSGTTTAPDSSSDAAPTGTTWGISPMSEDITLSLGYFSGAMHALPFYIMETKGWLEELGISLEYQSFISGPAMMEANGDWDIASTGGPGAISGILGYDITVLGIADKENVLNLYVREDSPIAKSGTGNIAEYPNMYGTVDDWKGTEWLIPVGTTMHQTLVTILEQIGLTANDVTMINMDVTTALTAFKAGEGDGLAVWTSTAIEAEQLGYVKAAGADTNGVIVPTTVLATDKALGDPAKREAITKMWELYFITTDWIMDNLDDAAELYMETCTIEGVSGADNYELCHESLSRFKPYGLEDELTLMNNVAADPMGLAKRELTGGEIDLFNTLDFFISQEKYTSADRDKIIDNNKVSSEIAEAVAAARADR